MPMKELADELAAKRAQLAQMGGAEKIEKQHARGKLSARERIDKLFDAGSFLEIGIHGTQMMGARATPADACICGYGKIRGRDAAVIAYDFTVLGGSIGETGERKATRIREIALKERIPVIWLIDSAGARISPQDHVHGDQVSLFAGSGYLFKEQVIMSGVVPQVAAMVGPGAAGTAYIPGLADFVPMVKGTSSMALGGPPLVKAVVGEEISEEDLGGSKVHNEVSGVADLEVENDEACLEAVKEYLSFFPQHSGDKPERAAAPAGDIAALLDEKFLSIVPDNPRQGYDMKKVIKGLVDDGKLFEMKPKWAKNLVTGFARIGGYPVGIVANNPMFLGGALDVNSADKAARFVWLCDAFNVPLLFLSDTPGFLIGSKMEQAGIIRHGAKMLYAVSDATVPKITVVVRKSYGAGYYVMCGRAYDPDMILAWPTGEISVMGAEGMAGIATKKLEGGDPAQLEAAKKGVVDMIKPLINIYKVAGWGLVDDVIDPRETRAKIFRALELTRNKTIERPRRKHGVIPV